MSTKIYDAFKVNSSKRSSVKTCVELANHSKQKALEKYTEEFSNMVLRRMFAAKDLVDFYGEDILTMEKFQEYYLAELIQSYIKVREPSRSEMENLEYFWPWAAHDATKVIKYLNEKIGGVHHVAELVFIPCGNQMFVMYFGDPTYRSVISEDTEHYLDYHYQNQVDKPEHISDAEWEQRERDQEKAIGPDYVPANHGLSVKLLDADGFDAFVAVDRNFKNAYAKRDTIKEQRIRNVFETITCPLIEDPEKVIPLSEAGAAVNDLTETDAYKAWKAETIAQIKTKLGLAD